MSTMSCQNKSCQISSISMSSDITVNECIKYQMYQSNSGSTLCAYHISQSPYTANQYMTHSNIR